MGVIADMGLVTRLAALKPKQHIALSYGLLKVAEKAGVARADLETMLKRIEDDKKLSR